MSGRCLFCYVRPLLSLYGIIYVTWYTRLLPKATSQIPVVFGIPGHTNQNINILRFVLTIKQKSGRLPISPFLRCPNHGRVMVGRIMEPLAYGVMMIWSSQCVWLTSWSEILKNSTILMMMTITRLVSSSSSSEFSSTSVYPSVYPSADRLALQKWGYWLSSRFLFDS